jgi:hypothetical protein
MPVLRVASLAIVALWMGGLTALTLVGAPPEYFDRFRGVAWSYGGGLIALLVLRAALGPRPRHTAIQLGLVAAMVAANIFPSSTGLTAITVAVGLAVYWIEARD